jgi:Flp pilus assembly protein CpaB
MQSRMPIIAALVAGLLAILLLNLYVGSVQEGLRPSLTAVVVASHQITAGSVLDAKDIAQAMRPTEGLPKLAVRWEERTLYLGQRMDFPVGEGDYLLASYFGGVAVSAQRLSEKIDIKANQRALTIPVTSETSLERSIRPGDRIDLLLTYSKAEVGPSARPGTPAGTSVKIVTTPLLENLYVIATGQFGTVSTAQYSTITLLVSPEEGMLLVWAMKLGDLSIMLRNPKDVALTDRAFLQGDQAALAELGKQPVTPQEIVSQRRAGVEK